MPAKPAVIEKDRMFRDVGCLQPGCHLAGVKRIAIPVGIAGDDHRCRIGQAIPNPMIGRVLRENGEIVGVKRVRAAVYRSHSREPGTELSEQLFQLSPFYFLSASLHFAASV